MKIIFSFLLLLLANFSFAHSISDYYLYINKAENSIIKDDYKSAKLYYDTAFSRWEKPFAPEIYNYLKCACMDSDYLTAKDLVIRLINLGCELSFFKKPGFLKNFRGTVEWTSIIYQYPMLRKKYCKNNNWEMRATIEQLQAKDQYLRVQRTTIDHFENFEDSTYKVDDTIKVKILKLIKTKFPNEYDYGLFMEDDTTFTPINPLNLIILHNYGSFDTSIVHGYNLRNLDFTPTLLAAVKSGDLYPEQFAQLNERAGKYMMGLGFGQNNAIVEINKTLYYYKKSPKIKDEINTNRQNIWLCDLEIEINKLIYDAKYNKNKFILHKSFFGIVSYGKNVFTEKLIANLFISTGLQID